MGSQLSVAQLGTRGGGSLFEDSREKFTFDISCWDFISGGKTEITKSYMVQGGPSGRGTVFLDIKFKVPSQFKLPIQLEVNKRLSSTRWATMCRHLKKD